MKVQELTRAEEKMFGFLVELHNILEVTDKVSLTKLTTRHRISKSTGTILKNSGIIQKEGKSYKWNTPVLPNVAMAKRAVAEVNNYTNQRAIERKARIDAMEKSDPVAETNETVESKPVIVSFSNDDKESAVESKKFEIVIFWGMFKYSRK